jgi:hypothetical protein
MKWAEPHFTDFVVKNTENRLLNINNIVMQGNNGQKYLKNGGDLMVSFFKSQSRITFLKEEVFFDHTGYFEAAAEEWDGEAKLNNLPDELLIA